MQYTNKQFRELDEQVYRRIPNLKYCQCQNGIKPKFGQKEYSKIRTSFLAQGSKERWPKTEPDLKCDCAKCYTTDSADAMEVLKVCGKKTFPTVYQSRVTEEWVCDNQTDQGPTKIIKTAATAELAIVLFALALHPETK